MREWLDRDEALNTLGVRPQTLYAYVSRGRIERRADPADPRRSLYRGDDILALTSRRERGKRPASIAASAMAWGEPMIATAISTVIHGRLIFRGTDAVMLAERATLEDVAALLWEQPVAPVFAGAGDEADPFRALAGLIADARPTVGRPAVKLCGDAVVAVEVLASALGAVGEGAMHARLARRWALDRSGAELIRRALVLLADHELNPSTFAARIAAATGASIAASLLAGLGTLSGPKHGGAGEAVAALVAEAANSGAEAAVARWLAAGHGLPGFGHPLYPHGDPRGAALMAEIAVDPALIRLRDAVAEATGAAPNIDFALIAVARLLDLPAGAAFRLFAIARSVGWAAHAMEQAASGGPIRPRATYIGALPD